MHEDRLDLVVSILAQPEGRALPGRSRSASSAAHWFQSSPSPKAGRYLNIWHGGPPNTPSFQSSPSPKAGRYGVTAAAALPLEEFQSSPSPKAGRYHERTLVTRGSTYEFQSSPSPKAGRYVMSVSDGRPAGEVSILAQPEGRALPRPDGVLVVDVRRFNPRPARRPGATAPTPKSSSAIDVFQSSPSPKAGRYALDRDRLPAMLAVSILAQPEGRALQAGAARAASIRTRVSILAQPEGRALQRYRQPLDSADRVSILAQPEGRALPATPPSSGRARPRFNPRPARRPGATRRRSGTCAG